MREFGATDAQIAAFLEHAAPRAETGAMAIHPDNVLAVRLFDAMQTQWTSFTLSTMSSARYIRTGLRYEALDCVARGLDLPYPVGDDFQRLRILEATALAAWNEAAQ